MNINLESLPLEIYRKIPIDIKTYKKEYELSELPYDIQKLLVDYNQEKIITYKDEVYDFDPVISEFGDFGVISNLRELIIKYAMSYLYILKGSYPFNGSVGSNIKRFIQTKDTTVRQLYLTEELNNMIDSFVSSFDVNVKVKDFSINRKESVNGMEYNLMLSMQINDESTNFTTSFIL
jgi:hypothetical protein